MLKYFRIIILLKYLGMLNYNIRNNGILYIELRKQQKFVFIINIFSQSNAFSEYQIFLTDRGIPHHIMYLISYLVQHAI